MKRKMITFCVALLLLLMCSHTVFAEEIDLSKTGSVSVALIEKTQNKPMVGAEFSLFYIASIRLNADESWVYDCTPEFERFESLIGDPSLVTMLDEFVAKHNVSSAKMITDSAGKALCTELPLGLYFVKQTGLAEGFAPCIPFLVTLPNDNNGEYVYEVNASPKTEVIGLTSIQIKKVWNTDASTPAAECVTIQLLKNEKVVKTAVLDAKNDWQVTYTDMPLSDAYSVKEVDIPKGFTVTYKQDGNVFTVTNTSTLIETGQLMWPIPVLAIGGMLLIALGIMCLQKKVKENA